MCRSTSALCRSRPRPCTSSSRARIRPGDVYLLNDPYRGGNHLPDLTAFVPVFDGDRLAFWSINRSHQSDIGGATHGAYNASATEIFQEGIRIPPLMLYEQGKRREDVYEMIVLNVRHPRDFRGDLAAMIGSARIGERRLAQLLAEFGSATTHAGGRGRARRRRATGAGDHCRLEGRHLRGRGVSRRRRPRRPATFISAPASPSGAATSRST